MISFDIDLLLLIMITVIVLFGLLFIIFIFVSFFLFIFLFFLIFVFLIEFVDQVIIFLVVVLFIRIFFVVVLCLLFSSLILIGHILKSIVFHLFDHSINGPSEMENQEDKHYDLKNQRIDEDIARHRYRAWKGSYVRQPLFCRKKQVLIGHVHHFSSIYKGNYMVVSISYIQIYRNGKINKFGYDLATRSYQCHISLHVKHYIVNNSL